jgi:beta-N-acetylhexosaminidase
MRRAFKKTQTLPENIGQLFVIGFDGTEMSAPLAELLTRVQPAGVILFGRNIVNAQQTHRLLKECQACVREPLLTCVDLEGGRVDRFRSVFGSTPSAADVFASAKQKLFRQHGAIIGKACRLLGFNIDFAPVLDLAFAASRSVMSSRSVSADPKQVIGYAREFLAGLRSAGVVGCGKHFPGLGEGDLDSHHDLPVIEKSFKKLWDEDLVPYRLMKRELPLVLVNHANYPAVTGDSLPASVSKKWSTDVLRRRLGYRGLIASDDMEMAGVLKAAPIDDAAAGFIRAGGDLCLICHQREYVERAFETMCREYERDRKFRARADESGKRVAAFKRKYRAQLRGRPEPTPEKVEQLSRQLWEFSERVRLYALSASASAGARG